MSTYFKDRVEEIKKDYPHPVEQFIVLSFEGHHDAANALISDYTMRYKNAVDKVYADTEDKQYGFYVEDDIQVEEKLGKEFLRESSRLYTSSMTVEERENACNLYTRIIQNAIDEAHDKSTELRFDIDWKKSRNTPKNEQERLMDEAYALETKKKVLSLFFVKVECLSQVNNKEPDDTDNPIPSGRCMVM